MRLFDRPVRLPMILLGALSLLIFLHYIGILSPLEGLVGQMLAPLQRQTFQAGISVNGLYENSEISPGDYEEILKQRDSLLIENSQLKLFLNEYQQFNQQSSFLSERGFNVVNAHVIGKNFQTDSQLLIIDKGFNDGVKEGFAVIVKEGTIVAKVIQSESHRSTILLLDDSQSSLAGVVQNENKVQGVVTGERGLSIVMELIPEDAILLPGEVVITSGLEELIPRGLVIGRIERVQDSTNTFFQTAFIEPLVDFNDLTVVSVVMPNSL